MAQTTGAHADPDATRCIEPRRPRRSSRPRTSATSRSSSTGNLYLLTDPFGDIHPDSRGLGLYDGDTRRLSCAILRVNGAAPRAAPGVGRRQLARDDPDDQPAASSANPRDKVHPEEALARRSWASARPRVLDAARSWRSGCGSSTTRRRRRRSSSSWSSPPTQPTSSRSGAGSAAERGHQLPIALRDGPGHVPLRRPGRRPAGPRTSPSRERGRTALCEPDVAGSATPAGSGWLALDAGARARRAELTMGAWTSGEAPGRRPDGRADARCSRPAAASTRTRSRPRTTRGTAASRRSRTDNELFNLAIERSRGRPAAARQRRARARTSATSRPACPWFTTLFGRDSLISVVPGARVPAADGDRDARGARVRSRRRARTRSGTRSPARSCTSCGPARWPGPARLPAHALLRHGGRDAAVARAARRDVRLDRRPGAGRPAVAERAPGARVDRQATATATATGSSSTSGGRRRASSTRAGRTRTTRSATGTGTWPSTPIALAEVQGYVFDAKRRMAALARVRGEGELAARLDQEAETLRAAVRGRVLVRGPAASTRWRSTARSARRTRSARTPGTACGAGSCRRSGRRPVVERLMAPDMFRGWGIRTYAPGQPGYNPIGYHTGTVWPHDMSLIAAGLQALRLPRRGEPAGGPDLRGEPALRGLPAARAVLRLRPRRRRWSRSRTRSRARRRRGRRARCSCSSRRCWACAPHADRRELELHRPELPDWLAKVTVTDLRVGDATVDLLFHRWRGGTSRGGAPQEPATSTSPSGCEPEARRASTVAELVARATERLARVGIELAAPRRGAAAGRCAGRRTGPA